MRIIPVLFQNIEYRRWRLVCGLGIIGLISVGLIACAEISYTNAEGMESESSPLRIMATIPIVEDWVKEIAGERAVVRSIIPYGVNPHSYHLGAKETADIIESDIVFAVGLGYEPNTFRKLMESHQDLIVINLGDFIDPRMYSKDWEQDEGDRHDEHDHGDYDPHFWFDPIRVASAVQVIADKMAEMNPKGDQQYQTRASEYRTKLEGLDEYIKDQITEIPKANRTVMTSHESLGYLGERYDLVILQAVIPSVSGERETGPGHLVKAVELIKDHDVQVIFSEYETSDGTAQVVAEETGIQVMSGLRVETLRDRNETYISFMKDNVRLISETLKDLP